MRKYRGVTKDDKDDKWVYGWYAERRDSHYNTYSVIIEDDLEFEVIPETVGQFADLHDKNGKDLDWWEGDMFKMHGWSIPWVIVKEQGCFWFKCPVTKERKLCYRVAEYFNKPQKIGDVHSNPALLEEKK